MSRANTHTHTTHTSTICIKRCFVYTVPEKVESINATNRKCKASTYICKADCYVHCVHTLPVPHSVLCVPTLLSGQ